MPIQNKGLRFGDLAMIDGVDFMGRRTTMTARAPQGGAALAGLALAAAMTGALAGGWPGVCLAQEAAAPAFTLTAPAADPGRAVLEVRPCLDAPGCGRPAQPLMPERAAFDLRADPGEPSAVPLPAALALMGAGMAALALLLRRRAA